MSSGTNSPAHMDPVMVELLEDNRELSIIHAIRTGDAIVHRGKLVRLSTTPPEIVHSRRDVMKQAKLRWYEWLIIAAIVFVAVVSAAGAVGYFI